MSNNKKQLRDYASRALERAGIAHIKNVKLNSKYPKNFRFDLIDIAIVDEEGNHLLFIETRSNTRDKYCGFIKGEMLKGQKGLRRSWRYSLHGVPLYLIQDYNKVERMVKDVQEFLKPEKTSLLDLWLQAEI